MSMKINYVDPGTNGLIASNSWYFVVAILGIITSFFLGIFKYVKKSISKIWRGIRNLFNLL